MRVRFLWRALVVPGVVLSGIAFAQDQAVHRTPEQQAQHLAAEIAELSESVERLREEKDSVGPILANAQNHLKEDTRTTYRMSRVDNLPWTQGYDVFLGELARNARMSRVLVRSLSRVSGLRSRLADIERERAASDARLVQARAELMQVERSRYAANPATFVPVTDDAEWYGDGVDMPTGSASSASQFLSQKGHLPVPLAITTTIRETTREDGVGYELSGPVDAPVLAIFPGRVVVATQHPTYGTLIVVDHGGGYFSVYAGIGRADVHLGTELERGTEIGALGSQPLFFQLRQGTRALPPREWIEL